MSLLIALAGWFIPVETVAKPYVFTSNKNQTLAQNWSGNDSRGVLQLRQQESVIYKTDAPAIKTENKKPAAQSPAKAPKTNKTEVKPSVSSTAGTQTGLKSYSKEEVKALIVKYSNEYGINPEVPLCIALHESGYNALAKNKSSSAAGVFQYLASTWSKTDEGLRGDSVFNAESNIKAAIKYMASRKNTNPWEVKNKCPKL